MDFENDDVTVDHWVQPLSFAIVLDFLTNVK